MSKKQIVEPEREPTELKLDDMKKVLGGLGTARYALRASGGENNQGNDNSQGDEPGVRTAVYTAR
jgi:hypothetical protein